MDDGGEARLPRSSVLMRESACSSPLDAPRPCPAPPQATGLRGPRLHPVRQQPSAQVRRHRFLGLQIHPGLPAWRQLRRAALPGAVLRRRRGAGWGRAAWPTARGAQPASRHYCSPTRSICLAPHPRRKRSLHACMHAAARRSTCLVVSQWRRAPSPTARSSPSQVFLLNGRLFQREQADPGAAHKLQAAQLLKNAKVRCSGRHEGRVLGGRAALGRQVAPAACEAPMVHPGTAPSLPHTLYCRSNTILVHRMQLMVTPSPCNPTPAGQQPAAVRPRRRPAAKRRGAPAAGGCRPAAAGTES